MRCAGAVAQRPPALSASAQHLLIARPLTAPPCLPAAAAVWVRRAHQRGGGWGGGSKGYPPLPSEPPTSPSGGYARVPLDDFSQALPQFSTTLPVMSGALPQLSAAQVHRYSTQLAQLSSALPQLAARGPPPPPPMPGYSLPPLTGPIPMASMPPGQFSGFLPHYSTTPQHSSGLPQFSSQLPGFAWSSPLPGQLLPSGVPRSDQPQSVSNPGTPTRQSQEMGLMVLM